MYNLHAGDCEHCLRKYKYSLWHSGFGESSYAYCDTCGTVAVCSYRRFFPAMQPPTSAHFQVIEQEWEHLLAPCACGGAFRSNAAPRCVFCRHELSADYATGHIERNSRSTNRQWRWQRNWTGLYCIALEEPNQPGTLRLVSNPFARPWETPKKKSLIRWPQILSFSR